MVQGTSSSAGKSLLVAALCRIFARRGVRVAPFKAQNMSNNAAVCADGAEIGRSQALQALAAGVAPTSDMNPVLLKPEADVRSQVIVNGRPWKTLGACGYFQTREELWPVVTAALERLRSTCELVIIEGAGSPAELNLRDVEIVNMAIARHVQAPVLLVGDIERGGVFAQLLGTLWLLPPEERSLVRGLIVNKFRGERSLFDAGVRLLEERGGVPVLGVVPWIFGLHLPEEDAGSDSSFDSIARPSEIASAVARPLDIAVIRLPRIANFDDFDPLAAEPLVQLRYVESAAALREPDVIILPGTKSTMADLAWLHDVGLAGKIVQRARNGTSVVGICGGYQMLGRRILDPLKIESDLTQMPGLGLLDCETRFEETKATCQVEAVVRHAPHCPAADEMPVRGYEIHMARTSGGTPWLELTRRNGAEVALPDGAVSPDGRIWGCYLHGLFANDSFRRAWLESLRGSGNPAAAAGSPETASSTSAAEAVELSLDRLADEVEAALDLQRLEAILRE